ncbi:MAG TPA: DUF222 domain-containing protein [Mycobacteriales bacterium]|nr:DUF222 domain-containing protein [Mycobacteriales bacterium]
MSSSGGLAGPANEFLDRLDADLKAGLPIGLLESADRIAVADRLETITRKMYFLQVGVVQSLEDSRAASQVGAPSLSALLQYRLRLSPSEANTRVRAARALCESRSITGESIPPPLPVVAAAAGAGEISGAHVNVIERTLRDLPDDIAPDVRDSVEHDLVEYARQFDPKTLRRLGREILLRISPKDPDPEKNRTRRSLTFQDDLPGLVAIRGRCTAEAAAIIQAALDPLAKPKPEIDGIKDLRTHPQRTMDALEELAGKSLKAGQVTITCTTDDLKEGVVHLPWAGPVALNSADWMLCDTAITFTETDENGVPIRMSKPQRTIPGHLRRAVYARDMGCTFPGCTRPIGWSDIHHVIPWEKRNEHQIDNLVTLCGYHHRLVHLQKWRINFIHRIPHYRPPRWIDCDQKPIRNDFHRTARNQPLRT